MKCDVGVRFGRLLVIAEAPPRITKSINRRWLCRCDCGSEKVVFQASLRSGNTKSCGCILRDGHHTRKHGMSRNNPTYRSWNSMVMRCRHQRGPYYAARGITVCERWHNFENFLADMGERPPGTSLDRIDVNGHYEPSNCRWAPDEQQQNNKRSTVKYEAHGELLSLPQWERRCGIGRKTLALRLKAGMTLEAAMALPILRNRRAGLPL